MPIATKQAETQPEANPETPPSVDPALWVDQFADSLYRYAMAKTGDASVAEDLVQDTFVAAVSRRDSFRNQSAVLTWLLAILKRKVADHYRKQSRHPMEQFSEEQMSWELDATRRSVELEPKRWSDDPAKICEDREFWKTFNRCVDKLPSKLFDAFILREVNQQSLQEVRELLGASATNLSMRLHRSRMAVRDCLNKNWFGK